jgi:hypothetical protein
MPDANAHRLYCYDGTWGTDPHALILMVTPAEHGAFKALPGGPSSESVLVRNQDDGWDYRVSRASCGASCFCAAMAVRS